MPTHFLCRNLPCSRSLSSSRPRSNPFRRFWPMSAQPVVLTRSLSNAAWSLARNLNSILPQGKLQQPPWTSGPLPRRCDRVQIATGVPRRTLSLCPDCNREALIPLPAPGQRAASLRGISRCRRPYRRESGSVIRRSGRGQPRFHTARAGDRGRNPLRRESDSGWR